MLSVNCKALCSRGPQPPGLSPLPGHSHSEPGCTSGICTAPLAQAVGTCETGSYLLSQSSICASGRWKHPLLMQMELCALTHTPATHIEPSPLPSCQYAKLERLGTTDLWHRVDLPAYITHINLPAYITHINSYWSPDSTKLECSFYDLSMNGLRTYPSL